jgi:outer membrane protein assembly factor BamB
VDGGDGYSSIAVVGGKAVTLVQRDDAEWVLALDVSNGKTLWQHKIGAGFKNDYGHGPRSTPAIEGSRVYATSVNGPVLCLELADGKVVWEKDLLKEFNAKNITWGLSASPMLAGDVVLVIPGSATAGVAALNKNTGAVVWKTGGDKAGYASPITAKVGAATQAVFFTGQSLLGVDLADGKQLWRMPWKTDFDCNICTPLHVGDAKIFVASGEKVGGALLELQANETPKIVWESRGPKGVMTTYWANAVVQGEHLYGLSGEFSGVINLNCVELKTGKLVWSQPRFGKGSITLADKHLFITTKRGDLVLVEADPTGYKEKARLKDFIGENRTVPTLADGRLFLRDRGKIVCLDLRGK